MLVELKAKSQVTIPKDIVNSMELNQGDQFEGDLKSGRKIESYAKRVGLIELIIGIIFVLIGIVVTVIK